MPRTPESVTQLEELLSDQDWAFIVYTCTVRGIPTTEWHSLPALFKVIRDNTAVRIMREVLSTDPTRIHSARHEAAARTGMDYETLRTRVEFNLERSPRAKCTHTPSTD